MLAAACLLPGLVGAALVRDNLYGVKALGDTEAWAVGNFGTIVHTTDGGRTWQLRESGTTNPLFSVDFADAAHGWVVGTEAVIFHTADAGRTWIRQRTPIGREKPLFKVAALDPATAWVVGDWGAIAVTHDGGATWEDRSLPDDVVLYDVTFPDRRHGFIAGEFGTLLATADGGVTWEKRNVGLEKTLFGIGFADAERGWAVGIDGLIVRTVDGGRTWSVQRGAAESGSVEDIGFMETLKNPGFYAVRVQGRTGVVVGDTGTLLTSADGGETWTRHELPEKQRLVWMRDVSLDAGSHGFVVGAGGFAAVLDGDRIVLPAAKATTVSSR
ncbi:MAG TPA: YCF48-related protein [Candidatus Binatia bacterium]|nr:YCF48-related protein [Candidatus Binatia bacterium]